MIVFQRMKRLKQSIVIAKVTPSRSKHCVPEFYTAAASILSRTWTGCQGFRIDVSGIQDAKTQQQALQAMTKQLTGYGYQISDDAVFKLIASESHSDNYKREFRRAGSSNTVIVDYRYHLTNLKLILGENVIWQTSRSKVAVSALTSVIMNLQSFKKMA